MESENGRPRVAILGGGMAGLTAAWRLSEPGWRDRLESITVFQRGHRLGGKGASSRGPNGRIEEHGLHVWLGHYDNAFRLMRDCYAELDRAHNDPTSPIREWTDAFIPSPDVGMFDHHDGVWRPWLGQLTQNDSVPGDPDASIAIGDVREIARRVNAILRDFVASFEAEPRPTLAASRRETKQALSRPAAAVLVAAASLEALSLAATPLGAVDSAEAVAALDVALVEIRDVVSATATGVWGARQAWHLVGLLATTVRGALADRLVDEPGRLRDLNDEEFCDWLRRHGASEATIDSTYVRGLYDLVFGHAGGDPSAGGFGAGIGFLLGAKTLIDYKGSLFWKMRAGMGDVVFAPLYECLRARGVDFEFFHRVDALHVSDDGESIKAITLGRQAALADGHPRYEPLIHVNGVACFPESPLIDQLTADPAIADAPLEAAWCAWPDVETRVLKQGVDFDQIVFAIPPPMARDVCAELVESRRAWREMVDNVATVATQSLQLWLRDDEQTLGWERAGSTMTGYVDGFDTWASMPQLLDAEVWPPADAPRAIAYFCNTLDGAWPPVGDWADHAAAEDARVRATAESFCATDLKVVLPGFSWDQLCGAPTGSGAAGLDTQYWRANVDPSDRYVQSLAGTDKYRLRPDESGFDNMFLAGDWTDCGLNAGCIEAAVLSGLQAANAVGGRHRWHRIIGTWWL